MANTSVFSVPDMSCGHCKASIEAALAPLNLKPSFDMTARQITLDAPVDQASVIAALDGIGFDATLAHSD